MKKLAFIGRLLFALPFGVMGLNHFLMTDVFIGMMSSFIPGGAFSVLLTGALLILGCILIILNKNLRIVSFGLAGFLFLFIVTIHIPGLFKPDWQISLIELLKDVALMGSAIMIGVFADVFKSDDSIKE
ncbi:DoxX family protein [Paludibacter propionicigenes WB4]|jgi:putative oxidoreductase|uniref:DoxX family protein n=1 Tax=Paludibacter propionicigenes (strain DSM 17365 / JCM 13257 / WB4) TaxID=694427 RepID=E4T0J5_PALPW|nr:DoxX family protein [Paludibacter propionicigenes]ADQ81059.1 DoxX family protein [Paludibacter propionicigenes WB4]